MKTIRSIVGLVLALSLILTAGCGRSKIQKNTQNDVQNKTQSSVQKSPENSFQNDTQTNSKKISDSDMQNNTQSKTEGDTQNSSLNNTQNNTENDTQGSAKGGAENDTSPQNDDNNNSENDAKNSAQDNTQNNMEDDKSNDNQSSTPGEAKGIKYTNEYFGLEFDIPGGWYILSEEEKADIMAAINAMIAGNSGETPQAIQRQTQGLVFAFKYPLTYAGPNPNVVCMAEKLDKLTSVFIKTGKDYLAAVRASIEMTGMNYSVGDLTTENLGGKDFHAMEVFLDAGSEKVTQKYYAAVLNDSVLVFISTYYNDEDVAELKSIMDTIKFK